MITGSDDIPALLARVMHEPHASILPEFGESQAARETLDLLAQEAERSVITDVTGGTRAAQALVALCDAAGERRARSRRALAQALAYANRFPEAEQTLEEAIRIAQADDNPLETAQCRLMCLHALARQGRFDEAIAMGEASRRAFVAAGEEFHAARADINIGVTLRMKGEPALAIDRFDRALGPVGVKPLVLAQLQSNRAEALLDLHRFAEALGAFEAAMTAFEHAGAHRAAAIVQGNIADLCGRQGRLDEALEHFERARRKLSAADAPGDAARLEVERAETLLQLGLFDEANDAFSAALSELRSRNMAPEAARAQTGIGRALLARAQFSPARHAFERAIAQYGELGNTGGQASVRLLLARALLGSRDTCGAGATLLPIVQSGELKPAAQAEATALLAIIAAREGRILPALDQIHAAIEQASLIDLPILLAELYQHQAWIHELAGDVRAALKSLDSAMSMVERVRSGLRGATYRAVLSGTFVGAYDEFVRLWLDSGQDPVHALSIVERGRARALLDELGAGPSFSVMAADKNDDARLLRARGELHALISAAHARADAGLQPRTDLDHPAHLESMLTDVELRLAATRRFAGDFAPPPSGEHIVAAVPTGCVLIEYFWERDSISACVVRDGKVQITRGLCTRERVRDRLGALRLQIAIGASRGFVDGAAAQFAARADAHLRALGDLLLRPLWDGAIGADQILIVADAELASVPFHALWVGGECLLDLADVATAPSASVMCRLSDRSLREGERVAIGVADERAPHAQEESLAAAHAMNATRVLVGKDATVGAAKAALQDAARVHIASHARFVAHSPMQSAIKLADGWLTARDLYDVELAGGVVVVSACDSGRTGIAHGRELLGLARAFMSAGAGTLVLSHWRLHDATAAKLLTDMYGLWYRDPRHSSRPITALRKAQRVIRERMPHVGAWGGLYAVGGWQRGER